MSFKYVPTILFAASSMAFAGGVGEPAPGFRMYSPTGDTNTYLIDADGEFVHTWTSNLGPTAACYQEPNGVLTRTVNHGTGPAIGGAGGGIQRQSFDGTITWDYLYDGPEGVLHHDIALLPNGNVLAIAWELSTTADAIAEGRDPALVEGTEWYPDEIIELEQTGLGTADIVWRWRMMDHVVQDFDVTKPNFGDPADHPELLDLNYPPTVVANGDWNHCNAIDYLPSLDLILISSPFQNEFWVIDHSTTTAEAAGHTGGTFGKGGDFLYRWGNPLAYGAGTEDDQQLFFQHSTHWIPEGLPGAGNILIFNNRAGTPDGLDHSSVVELELPPNFSLDPGAAYGPEAPLWVYTTPDPEDFYSNIVSSARRLPNGNTLVCAGNQSGWIFEVTSAGDVVWEHFNQTPTPTAIVFMASYWERTLWADRDFISTSAGGLTRLDMVAGSKHAGDFYLVIGSFAGTTPGFDINGVNLPLNPDPYFILTLTEVNDGPFQDTFGVLDSLGNGQAGLNLPPGAANPFVGANMYHAYLVGNSATQAIEMASNAVALELRP